MRRHLEIRHNPNAGRCDELGGECPLGESVWTVENEQRLADDPTRQWTEYEIDQGLPWKGRVRQ